MYQAKNKKMHCVQTDECKGNKMAPQYKATWGNLIYKKITQVHSNKIDL